MKDFKPDNASDKYYITVRLEETLVSLPVLGPCWKLSTFETSNFLSSNFSGSHLHNTGLLRRSFETRGTRCNAPNQILNPIEEEIPDESAKLCQHLPSSKVISCDAMYMIGRPLASVPLFT